MSVRPHNARALLLALGMGNFNITGVVPFLFYPVAATDSDSPSILLLVQAIQNNLNAMGAKIQVTGQLDVPTVYALRQITGKDWPAMHWHDIVTAVVNARERGYRFKERLDDADTPAAVGRFSAQTTRFKRGDHPMGGIVPDELTSTWWGRILLGTAGTLVAWKILKRRKGR